MIHAFECADCGGSFSSDYWRKYCEGCGTNSARSFRKRFKEKHSQRKHGVYPCDHCGNSVVRRKKSVYGFCSSLCRILSSMKINIEDYRAAIARAKNRCEICGTKPKGRRLAIDHCHTTGKFRGVLCSYCNTAIGLLKDSPKLAEKASEYLRVRN